MAIFTFLESYDFSGKTIILFCTSGSSSIDISVETIYNICKNSTVLDGFRVNGQESIKEWMSRIDQIKQLDTTQTGKTLIAYFSLYGNTDNISDTSNLDATSSASIVMNESERFGTTEYIAQIIQEKTDGDLHLIKTVDSYPNDFDSVVDQNHKEINQDYFPELSGDKLDMSQYDIIFVGYPVWASTVPKAIHSFLSAYELKGKIVIPFCTHDGYGSGDSYTTIANLCPKSECLDGIAIEAKDVKNAEESISSWLNKIGMISKIEDSSSNKINSMQHSIAIKTGNITLEGILYDDVLAKEISKMFPLTVSMVDYGGREFYGSLSRKPENVGKGQYNFKNGDITYCAQNNTIAIFYAQTANQNLTMEVIPIGKVTSDLSVFNSLGSNINFTFTKSSGKSALLFDYNFTDAVTAFQKGLVSQLT